MKHFFAISILLLSMNVFGQAPGNKTNWLTIPPIENKIKVIYVSDKIEIGPAFFINDKFVGDFGELIIDPENIDSIQILKVNFQIDSIHYYGKILITTKPNYHPQLISLNALKDKYTNLNNKAVIFMIDGNIINADYDKYHVDENYVLQITVDKIKNTKENIDLGLIKILTRTEENIKKSEVKFIR